MPAGSNRLSTILGTDVVGLDAQKLGDIDEVVFDRDGRAAAVVVGLGGALGLGTKDVAVPYGSLKWNYDIEPSDPPSASNTGGERAADGGSRLRTAETTRPGNAPPEVTGTVGDPARPNEGLTPQGATVPVGNGEPIRAMLLTPREELAKAPEFRLSR
jgi:hypothetical protein